jgi:hypothetical protein
MKYYLGLNYKMYVLEAENAISSRAPWSPISQTSKNSKFKVSKNSKNIS